MEQLWPNHLTKHSRATGSGYSTNSTMASRTSIRPPTVIRQANPRRLSNVTTAKVRSNHRRDSWVANDVAAKTLLIQEWPASSSDLRNSLLERASAIIFESKLDRPNRLEESAGTDAVADCDRDTRMVQYACDRCLLGKGHAVGIF